ncbi:rab-GTPase-TBC domain-containing protein [Lentinula aciculospora]|uniref:Rab-GTPase-TBC domain-containing protein n=1 Tax=Lentinula aciculospora TaxID=153920 RepID=A0A9W8ZWI3_9AGAR|nr:rab-GTPase-TBC domain-containing protein [Lentinula aciculospora]
MAAPPTRPHIVLRPSSYFKATDTVDDDAWDSASDSEEPAQSTFSFPSWSRSSTTAPKPVPKPITSDNSSSTTSLAFSYTHLNAPNPSSYPPRTTDTPQPPKNGWTIVRTVPGRRSSNDTGSSNQDDSFDHVPSTHGDADVEGDMILGDLDPEPTGDPSHSVLDSSKSSSIRADAENIVNDPLCGIRRPAPISKKTKDAISENPEKSDKLMRERSIRSNRKHKFVDCLSSQDVNIAELRKLAWAGIPNELRPMAWQLLLGYLPLASPLRAATLARKRNEYTSLVEVAFARDREGVDQQIWHQIEIDVPRTRPGVHLWMYGSTQRSLERILYVWAIRHPASGYVQGINDLVTPFFQVFLSAYIDSDPEDYNPELLPKSVLDAIEADSFWCLSRLLDGIQDNYIFAQPGIQRSVRRMADLVARIDAPLFSHLESQNVEFMQFAFRWMNCLLMREISVQNTIRMWDTYLAEGPDAFSQFHLYVCSAFLVKWSEKLRQMDFQGIIMFLQSLPTQGWGDHEVEMLLSEAFVLNSIWHNAQSHFNGK